MDSKAYQIVTIDPETFTVVENQTQGPITGVKSISLSQTGMDTNKTEIKVVWNLDYLKYLA